MPALSQLAFCFVPRPALLDSPVQVEVAAVLARQPWALIVRHLSSSPGLRMVVVFLVDVALRQMMPDIVRIDRQPFEAQVGAASGFQAQLLVLQLHQKQLVLFFLHWLFSALPRQPFSAPPPRRAAV